MEISFGKLQYLALELASLNPPRPALSRLEIAPSSQLAFEERGIGHSAPPCHITGLSPGLTRNKVLRMEISFGKLQYLALELASLNPPRPALSRLEIAPSSQLAFEERGIGHSAGRRSRPAQ